MRTGITLDVKCRLKCGVFHSLVALQAAINRFLVEANENPKPFCWTKDPNRIIAAVRRGHQASDPLHQSPVVQALLTASRLIA
jgi:hypothetical protein